MESETQTAAETKFEPQKLLSEATKYTVLAAFVLYSIGFLIWHTYLASYGVSSIGFLQVEYLSAAFCFLILSVAVGLPPALLYERWVYKDSIGRKSPFDFAFFSLLIWSLIAVFVEVIFFPSGYLEAHEVARKIALACLFIFFPYSVIWIICRKKWPQSKFSVLELFNPAVLIIFSLWASVVVAFCLNLAVSKLFVAFTILAVLSMCYAGRHFRGESAKLSFIEKLLLTSFACGSLILDAQIFGDDEFGKIPREIGGGKPETAYVSFSTQRQELARLLNLPAVTNVALLNGFFGPVSVLLRTDKDIVFVNFGEVTLPKYVTNETAINITSNVATISFKTNVTDVSGSHLKNTARLTAKQIRMDLIDAIIFAK